MKRLRRDLAIETLKKGMSHLVKEASFLTKLSHPNIISLLAISGSPGSTNFSLVLNRLEHTLTKKLEIWQCEVELIKSKAIVEKKLIKPTLDFFFDDRILAAYGVASALNFLHSHK